MSLKSFVLCRFKRRIPHKYVNFFPDNSGPSHHDWKLTFPHKYYFLVSIFRCPRRDLCGCVKENVCIFVYENLQVYPYYNLSVFWTRCVARGNSSLPQISWAMEHWAWVSPNISCSTMRAPVRVSSSRGPECMDDIHTSVTGLG